MLVKPGDEFLWVVAEIVVGAKALVRLVNPEQLLVKRTWVVSTIGIDSGVAPRGQRSSVSRARKVLEK